MADNNSVVQSVKFYEFGKNSLWLSIVHNKQWNRYSLDITGKFTNTKDGETKEGSCSTYLNLTAKKSAERATSTCLSISQEPSGQRKCGNK